MPQLPDRKPHESMTEDEMHRLLDLVPSISSYIAACVAKGGDGATVRINISASSEARRWGMELVIPGKLLQKFAHLEGENIPRASTVLQMLGPQEPLKDPVVIAKSQVQTDETQGQSKAWFESGSGEPDSKIWFGDLPHGC